jgi:hypothetical protein
MNRAFVVATYCANPMDTAALGLRLNLLPVAVHAEDMRAVRNVGRPMLASTAVAISV